MFRLFLSAVIALASAISASTLSAQQAPTAPKPKTPSKPAVATATPAPDRKEISVVGGQANWIAEIGDLYVAPDYLQGGVIIRPVGNVLDMTANEDVQVLVAVTWAYDGDASGGWLKGRATLPQLVAQGWEPVGKIRYKQGAVGDYVLLRRSLKKGEQVKFHTRKFYGPSAVLPAPDKAAEVAKLPALVLPSNDLSAVRPPSNTLLSAEGKALLLRVHEVDRNDNFVDRGFLLRELVRQAVLLAAREELGLATRDETLRERWSERTEAGPVPLDIVVRPQNDGRASVTLFRFRGGKPELLWDQEFPLEGADMIIALTTAAERLSREEFPAALGKAGFKGKANARHDDTGVPEAIEKSVSELHWIPQFSAARQLHKTMREQGESPQLLAALSRVYAQLGMITDHLRYPGHEALKARSLLYAERAMALWPKSPAGRQARAFARALVGLHGAALDDLKAAAADESAPAWKPVVEAFCRFEQTKLNDLCQKGEDALPRLLRLMTVERYGGISPVVSASESFLELVPDGDRALDSLWLTEQLGPRRQVAGDGPTKMAERLYDRLTRVTDLPASADTLIRAELTGRQSDGLNAAKEATRRVELVRTLRAAGEVGRDVGEPSWQTLATLIEEVTYYHTERQLDFLANSLGVPIDSARLDLQPLVEDHPYRELVAGMCDDRSERARHLTALAASLRAEDISLNEHFLLTTMYFQGFTQQYNNLSPLMVLHEDYVYADTLRMLHTMHAFGAKENAAHLRRVSPHAPQAIAVTIQYDWEYSEPRAADWEQQYEQAAPVQKALGRQYVRQEKYADAARCLARAVKGLPDYETYSLLAKSWLKLNDEKKWLAAYDEFLQQEDFGLSHAQARVDIARHFMGEGRYAEALPYAEEAAGTWSEWSMECAAECHTGLKQYDEAEVYWQRIAQRYLPTCPKWYLWCRLSGQGDLEAARKFARQAIEDPAAGVQPGLRAMFLILEGEKDVALKSLESSLAATENPDLAWLAASLADELKQPEKRDAYLQMVIRIGAMEPFLRGSLVELAKLAQAALADAAKMEALPAAIDELLKKVDSSERTIIAGLGGRLLDVHGQEAGIRLLKEAAKSNLGANVTATWAAAELKNRKIKPE